ncbi:uncharacterized protein A1O9_11038 [Exophiala aquamarina CBS 119918]|uniref:EamA domain-containing protein n=1 Tax=Exophiala aquamarina CBS 119918 TaxID=1182545 RepID=A0A072PC17_9EURO|nr:uncharacterized protein A1O9_11038 [Exophiala aquamarina CBS 119918]KEF53130.1 hypothetical protein A1O9_11038 [Exophiala aquamarina CBS 119918]
MSQARKRRSKGKQAVKELRTSSSSDISHDILPEDMTATSSIVAALRRQPVWIVLAVSSGACAAFNGVFAKLTTTSLTSTLSSHIALLLSLSATNKIVEFLVRGTFFLLNLAFNAAMWALFTAALTRADSTTRVSIVNVSANFMITAVLGWIIFSEKLNGLWWGGASLLAIGNVVIGRREEAKKPGGPSGLDETAGQAVESEGLLRTSGDGEDLLELDNTADSTSPRLGRGGADDYRRLKRAEEADSPL